MLEQYMSGVVGSYKKLLFNCSTVPVVYTQQYLNNVKDKSRGVQEFGSSGVQEFRSSGCYVSKSFFC